MGHDLNHRFLFEQLADLAQPVASVDTQNPAMNRQLKRSLECRGTALKPAQLLGLTDGHSLYCRLWVRRFPWLCMAISLYGDESESRDPHVFTLAGFIASPSAWERFAPAWREMLSSTGPYPVDSFHANFIDKGNPHFDGWTISEREAVVSRVIAILADTTICANLYAIGCRFVLADLDEALPGAVGRGRTQDIYEPWPSSSADAPGIE